MGASTLSYQKLTQQNTKNGEEVHDWWATFMMMFLLIDLMIFPRLPTRGVLGYPLRISYFAVPLGLVFALRERLLFRFTVPLFIMIGSIICGSIIMEMMFDLPIRPTFMEEDGLLRYIFLPCFIALGYVLSKERMRYKIVLLCLIISAILTLLMTFHSTLSPIICRFYSVSDRVSGSYLRWRSPGIQNGVGKSTYTANVIFLILVVGVIREECSIWYMILGAIPTLAHSIIMGSRAGLGFFALILIVYIFSSKKSSISIKSRRALYVLILTPIFIVLIWSQLAIISELGRRVKQIDLLLDRLSISLTDSEQEDYILHRPIQFLPHTFERWIKSPILGTGLTEDQTVGSEFRIRHFHNDWFVVLSAGGIVAFVAMIILLWRIFRLEPILAAPFIIPGLTNAFISVVPAVLIYGIMVGYVIGRKNKALQESQESSEAALSGDTINHAEMEHEDSSQNQDSDAVIHSYRERG